MCVGQTVYTEGETWIFDYNKHNIIAISIKSQEQRKIGNKNTDKVFQSNEKTKKKKKQKQKKKKKIIKILIIDGKALI